MSCITSIPGDFINVLFETAWLLTKKSFEFPAPTYVAAAIVVTLTGVGNFTSSVLTMHEFIRKRYKRLAAASTANIVQGTRVAGHLEAETDESGNVDYSTVIVK